MGMWSSSIKAGTAEGEEGGRDRRGRFLNPLLRSLTDVCNRELQRDARSKEVQSMVGILVDTLGLMWRMERMDG